MNLGRSFVGFLVLSLMAGAVLWWGVSNGQAPSSQAAKAADEGLWSTSGTPWRSWSATGTGWSTSPWSPGRKASSFPGV